jgi:ABC-type Zn uptake system ZnuABC Zn-binding protein ZnuA
MNMFMKIIPAYRSRTHHAQDPHLWTSPQLMSRLAGKLAKELSLVFPNSALLFESNAQRISGQMNTLSERIKSEGKGFLNPAIITYHNSFA